MNLKQLIERTMLYLKQDRDAETYSEVTDSNEGLGITGYINDAYAIVVRENWKPFKTVSVTLDDSGCFIFEQILFPGEGIVRIEKISTSETDTALSWDIHERTDQIKVFNIKPGSEVKVQFWYLPAELVQEEDEPVFPAHLHSCLADYAAYRVLITGGASKLQRAQFYLAEFESKRRRLTSYVGAPSRTQFYNKYSV